MVNQAQAEAGEAGICRQAQDKEETVLEVLHAYGGKSLSRGVALVFVYELMQHGVTLSAKLIAFVRGLYTRLMQSNVTIVMLQLLAQRQRAVSTGSRKF